MTRSTLGIFNFTIAASVRQTSDARFAPRAAISTAVIVATDRFTAVLHPMSDIWYHATFRRINKYSMSVGRLPCYCVRKVFRVSGIFQFAVGTLMSGIKGSKCDSGAAKRKRKKVEESTIKSQKGALYKHFVWSDKTGDVPAPSPSSTSTPNSDIKEDNERVRCFIYHHDHHPLLQVFHLAVSLHSGTLLNRHCED